MSPQSAMTEEQHLREYTKALKARLPRHYFEPVPSRLGFFFCYLALVLVCGWGVVATPYLWLKLLLVLPLGQAYVSLGFFAHEILHGAVVKNPIARSIIGTIAFIPLMVGARLWRKWHNVEHHGNTQHPHDDPDASPMLEALDRFPAFQKFYKLAPWSRSLIMYISFTVRFSLQAFQMLKHFLPEFKGHERRVVLFQAWLPVVVWFGVLLLVGPFNFLFVFLLPWMIANFIGMSYVATNHLLNPITETNDPLMNSLTVRNPGWLEWLHLGFGYHIEHHVFPVLSPKYAARVAAEIKKLWPDRYNELPHWKALFYLWKTPRLYRDHRNLIEPTTGRIFGTLGFGLDDSKIAPTPVVKARKGKRPNVER